MDSFMEMYDPNTGERKKRKLTPSQSAQSATTNHSYTQGKSAVQGAQGVGQGNHGWEGQSNPILNSLGSRPTFNMPKITDKLTTQKGFNQALQVVGARNRAKLDMQNRKVLSGVLGSLLQNQSNRYTADSRANTQRLGMANRKSIAELEDETQRRGQDNMNNYYKGLLENQKNALNVNSGLEGQSIANKYEMENKKIAASKALEEKRYRVETIANGGMSQIYGSAVWGSMSDDQKSDATKRFADTGEIIPYESDNWFWRKIPWTDAELAPDKKNTEQTPIGAVDRNFTPPSSLSIQGGGQGQQEAFKLDANQTSALASRVAQEFGLPVTDINTDDEGNFVFPNGDTISMEKAWGRVNGTN